MNKRKRYFNEFSIHNNRTLLVLATILFIEQLSYGVIFTDAQTEIGRTHLFTSGVSFMYMLVLGKIFLRNLKGSKWSFWKELFQYSYLFFGLGIAIYRAVYIAPTHFTIPVIYIAVLYGSAFLFYYPPLWSLLLYATTAGIFIYLGHYENQNLLYSTFIQDIVVNNFLAWIGSLLAYQRFTRQVDSVLMIEEKNQELKQLSEMDTLTHLYNRRKLDEQLEVLHKRAVETNKGYLVIIADIDYFKHINDDYGHTIGDEVLIEIASIFKSLMVEHYILGRWGGEEFMILCEDTSCKEAYILAESLRCRIEEYSFNVNKQITCSFGISEYSSGLPFQEIVKKTDDALYKSKNEGRNRVTLGC